jgi:hypothetical protein
MSNRVRHALGRRELLFAIPVVLAGAWGVKRYVMPEYDVCPACGGERVESCGAPGCTRGRVPCPGPCLKPSSPGWQRMKVAGHGPNQLWMRFVHDDGSWTAWSRNHIGEVIEKVDGRWTNKGKCPTCQGRATQVCPACQAKRTCARCGGEGRLQRWF